jgi:putative phosphoesterase
MTTLVGLISDTHDNAGAILEANKYLKLLQPAIVIHCGDMTSPETLALFKELPLHAVFGNCDHNREGLIKAATSLGLVPPKDEIELEVEGKTLYCAHGHQHRLIQEMAGASIYNYIFHGHTHVRRDDLYKGTRIINPGALTRADRYAFATLLLPEGKLTTHYLDEIST